MTPEETARRIKICNFKIRNFCARITVDFGLNVYPVASLPTMSGDLDILGTFKYEVSTIEDVKKAQELLSEVDKRKKKEKSSNI